MVPPHPRFADNGPPRSDMACWHTDLLPHVPTGQGGPLWGLRLANRTRCHGRRRRGWPSRHRGLESCPEGTAHGRDRRESPPSLTSADLQAGRAAETLTQRLHFEAQPGFRQPAEGQTQLRTAAA